MIAKRESITIYVKKRKWVTTSIVLVSLLFVGAGALMFFTDASNSWYIHFGSTTQEVEMAKEFPTSVHQIEDEEDGAETPDIPDITIGTFYTNDRANLRSGPGVYYTIKRILPVGAEVDVVDHDVNGWSKVIYRGIMGYINTDLLSVTRPDNLPDDIDDEDMSGGNDGQGEGENLPGNNNEQGEGDDGQGENGSLPGDDDQGENTGLPGDDGQGESSGLPGGDGQGESSGLPGGDGQGESSGLPGGDDDQGESGNLPVVDSQGENGSLPDDNDEQGENGGLPGGNDDQGEDNNSSGNNN